MVHPYLILCSPGTDQIPTAINEDYPEKPANSGQIIMRIAIISDYILGFSHRHTSLTIIIIYIYIYTYCTTIFLWNPHPPWPDSHRHRLAKASTGFQLSVAALHAIGRPDATAPFQWHGAGRKPCCPAAPRWKQGGSCSME